MRLTCVSGVVFLGLKKAFDTVNHGILLCKLSSIVVSDHSLTWFESYLSDWKQATKVDSATSELSSIKHGVPQGSILGPLLFLIFIDDLCESVEPCSTSMYADDTAIFYMAKDADELRVSLQYDMQSISYWMREN